MGGDSGRVVSGGDIGRLVSGVDSGRRVFGRRGPGSRAGLPATHVFEHLVGCL